MSVGPRGRSAWGCQRLYEGKLCTSQLQGALSKQRLCNERRLCKRRFCKQRFCKWTLGSGPGPGCSVPVPFAPGGVKMGRGAGLRLCMWSLKAPHAPDVFLPRVRVGLRWGFATWGMRRGMSCSAWASCAGSTFLVGLSLREMVLPCVVVLPVSSREARVF